MSERFSRSAKYNRDWLLASVSGAANPLWLAEWLCQALPLRPGMRVLDLGCGKACSSIFLHKEFGVEVWAADLWFDPDQNLQRIRDAGAGSSVFPLRVNAHQLPFAVEFFDAIISLDSFFYFGTDDLYMSHLARFLQPEGLIGIAGSGLTQEIEGAIPATLAKWWTADMNCLHSAAWWSRHWTRSNAVQVQVSDDMPDGWRVWLDWHRIIAPENHAEIEALEADRGQYLGYVRTIAQRKPELDLTAPMQNIASVYQKQPVF